MDEGALPITADVCERTVGEAENNTDTIKSNNARMTKQHHIFDRSVSCCEGLAVATAAYHSPPKEIVYCSERSASEIASYLLCFGLNL